MVEFDNSISRNSNYVSRSSINRKQLDKWKVPKEISVESVKRSFDKTQKIVVMTGVGENSKYKRHTNYVKVDDLLKEVVKDNETFLHKHFKKK